MTEPPTDDQDATQVRPFADVLRDLKQGDVLDEAAVKLQETVNAVLTHGRKGTLTLKIEIAPMKGNAKVLLVSARADNKTPTSEPIAAAFFADSHGNLLRDDPDQLKLPLRRLGEPNLREANEQ